MGDLDLVDSPGTVFTSVRIVPVILGACLLISVFLPWISSSFMDLGVLATGADFSTELLWYGVIGGGVVIGAAFFKSIKSIGVICFATGFLSFVLIFMPVQSSGQSSGMNLSIREALDMIIEAATFGFYLHFISVFALILLGAGLLFISESVLEG